MARPKNLTDICFGDLPIGTEFWEKPDGNGYAFVFSHRKVEPEEIDGEIFTARTGTVLFGYRNDTIVQIEGGSE
jgi:hypothetical protein